MSIQLEQDIARFIYQSDFSKSQIFACYVFSLWSTESNLYLPKGMSSSLTIGAFSKEQTIVDLQGENLHKRAHRKLEGTMDPA